MYKRQDDPDQNARVYPQPVFDGEIAVKYAIKPEAQDGLPAVSLFGSVRSGFTADDRLDAEGEFLDQTPANGLPFLGVETQILVTQRLGQALRLHAAGGVHMSSKGLRIVPLLQIGVEFALSDSIWATADFSKTVFVNGFQLDNVSSGGLRYDINENASLSLFLVSKPGLQFKIPFIQDAVYLDSRMLNLDPQPEEMILSDQKRIIVDSFARYRIVNPLKFFQTVRNEATFSDRFGSCLLYTSPSPRD